MTFIFWFRPEPIISGASWVFRELVPDSYGVALLVYESSVISLPMSFALIFLMFYRTKSRTRHVCLVSYVLFTLVLLTISAYLYSFVWFYNETTTKAPIWDSSALSGTGYLVAMKQDRLIGTFFVGLSQGLLKVVLAVIWWRNTSR